MYPQHEASALLVAADNGHPRMVTELLQRDDVDVNLRNKVSARSECSVWVS